jgi:uncharacterized protein YndB with AHSA1/START domain
MNTLRQELPVLRLTRRIKAKPATVFRAWTNSGQLKKWWGPPGFTVPDAEIDLRVGGRYRIVMQPPQGPAVTLSGEYREVSPPNRLVYTWAWGDKPVDESGESLVTVEFRAAGRETELVIMHERLPEPAQADHEKGWKGCLDRLETLHSAA